MIPPFTQNGELPEGIYEATLEEVEERFCYNSTRINILSGLRKLIQELRKADCEDIYIDGSFITEKENPKDVDVCWGNKEMMTDEYVNTAITKSPILFLSGNKRYGCEFYPSYCETIYNGKKLFYIELFQISKEYQTPKGIIILNIA